MFCTHPNDKEPNVGWDCTQIHPTWKSGCINQKMLDEKFDQEQTSSNIVQHDFCLLFSFFKNFVSSLMHSTSCPTSRIYDIGWNVGCICVGLKWIQHVFLVLDGKKCWMKNLFWKKFHPTRFNMVAFFCYEMLDEIDAFKQIQHFVQHQKFCMLDEMLDPFKSPLAKNLLLLLFQKHSRFN